MSNTNMNSIRGENNSLTQYRFTKEEPASCSPYVASPYFMKPVELYQHFSGMNSLIHQYGRSLHPQLLSGFNNYYQNQESTSSFPASFGSNPYSNYEGPKFEASQGQQDFKAPKGCKSSSKSSTASRPPSKSKVTSPRKKVDRFDGVSEEEVAKKFLPDHIDHGLDILIIGINPGLYAAHKGHHYAGPGNHFWKCLFMSGLTPEQYTADDDASMVEKGIGFTNVVARTTRGSADLSKQEIEDGSKILLSKVQYYQPRIAVFNGKGIYEVFSGKKDFQFGRQPELIQGTKTHVWVMPSSSARCAQLPRAADKVPFYLALKKLLDHLKGHYPDLNEEELVFPKLKNAVKRKDEDVKPVIKQE